MVWSIHLIKEIHVLERKLHRVKIERIEYLEESRQSVVMNLHHRVNPEVCSCEFTSIQAKHIRFGHCTERLRIANPEERKSLADSCFLAGRMR